jgi:hypothetical protein
MNTSFPRFVVTGAKSGAILLLGWLEPAIYSLFQTIRWGFWVAALLGTSYVSILCLTVFTVDAHETPSMRLTELLTISILLELGIVGAILRRYASRKKDSATIRFDQKSEELLFTTAEGDRYPVLTSDNGKCLIKCGNEGRLATVLETVDGYHLTTDDDKEFLIQTLTWTTDWLPLALVAGFGLWVDVSYCTQSAGTLSLGAFPVHGFQVGALLATIFGCNFFRAAGLVVRQKLCPSAGNLGFSGFVLGTVVGWVGTNDAAWTIVTAMLMAVIYVAVGAVLRKR